MSFISSNKSFAWYIRTNIPSIEIKQLNKSNEKVWFIKSITVLIFHINTSTNQNMWENFIGFYHMCEWTLVHSTPFQKNYSKLKTLTQYNDLYEKEFIAICRIQKIHLEFQSSKTSPYYLIYCFIIRFYTYICWALKLFKFKTPSKAYSFSPSLTINVTSPSI